MTLDLEKLNLLILYLEREKQLQIESRIRSLINKTWKMKMGSGTEWVNKSQREYEVDQNPDQERSE